MLIVFILLQLNSNKIKISVVNHRSSRVNENKVLKSSIQHGFNNPQQQSQLGLR